MAIQFPPVNAGDPAPKDGDQFTDIGSQTIYVYNLANNAWTPVASSSNNLDYTGALNITDPAPADAQLGMVYSVVDGGVAHPSFNPITGEVKQWSLVVKSAVGWALTNDNVNTDGPFERTSQGVITPKVDGDNFSMLSGNYNLDILPEIKN
jgi:hypothetical protein